MTSNRRKSSLVAVMVLLGSTGIAEAQAPVGTRAAGLAGAFVGVADDASAVYWNPAGLATGPVVSILATFSDDKSDPDGPQAVAGEQLAGRMVALSLPPVGIAYYRLGVFGTEHAEPAVIGLPRREEVRRSVQALTTSTVGVSLLQSLTEYIVVGATPKVVWGTAARGQTIGLSTGDALDAASDLDGEGSTTFDIDAGVMFAMQHVRLGLMARNLTAPAFAVATAGRPGESGEVEEIELSREVRIGGAWGSAWPGLSRVVISVDGDLTSRVTPFGDRRDVAAGVETWWRDRRLGLRGGVRGSTAGEARAAVAAGVSWALGSSMFVEGHITAGQQHERGWSLGVRAGF